ncbi:hypothetical protein A0H81_03175 [Grifola frondosa]|uniref:Nudix hydrolase domain-containing protein n=1 Tax=Grifola frondosa TaxID=5627 RepID=A0A1C7MJR7_GRIFR|nr:hypothetical protein A0H81_03175 [Grifola frondosa]
MAGPSPTSPQTYLQLVDACDNFQLSAHSREPNAEVLVPWHLSPDPSSPAIGLLRPVIVAQLRSENANTPDDPAWEFHSWERDWPSEVAGEMYPVYRNPFGAQDAPAEDAQDAEDDASGDTRNYAFMMERAACALFGVVTYGVHMTIYEDVPAESQVRYSAHAGCGINSGLSMFECLVKEAMEEASIEERVIRQYALAVGSVSYFFRCGMAQPEVEFCYDLRIPPAQILSLSSRSRWMEKSSASSCSRFRKSSRACGQVCSSEIALSNQPTVLDTPIGAFLGEYGVYHIILVTFFALLGLSSCWMFSGFAPRNVNGIQRFDHRWLTIGDHLGANPGVHDDSSYPNQVEDAALGIASQLFVISLPDRTERRKSMDILQDTLGLRWTYVDAVQSHETLVEKIMSCAPTVGPGDVSIYTGGLKTGRWNPWMVLRLLRPFNGSPPSTFGSVPMTSLHRSFGPKCTHAYALTRTGATSAFATSPASTICVLARTRPGICMAFSVVPSIVMQRKVFQSNIDEGRNGLGVHGGISCKTVF